MYMYIYIYIHVYTYIYSHVYIDIYIYIYINNYKPSLCTVYGRCHYTVHVDCICIPLLGAKTCSVCHEYGRHRAPQESNLPKPPFPPHKKCLESRFLKVNFRTNSSTYPSSSLIRRMSWQTCAGIDFCVINILCETHFQVLDLYWRSPESGDLLAGLNRESQHPLRRMVKRWTKEIKEKKRKKSLCNRLVKPRQVTS